MKIQAVVDGLSLIASDVLLVKPGGDLMLHIFEGNDAPLILDVKFTKVDEITKEPITTKLIDQYHLKMDIEMSAGEIGSLSEAIHVGTLNDLNLFMNFRAMSAPNGQIQFTYNFFVPYAKTKSSKKVIAKKGRKKNG